jgi:hypothetical protein
VCVLLLKARQYLHQHQPTAQAPLHASERSMAAVLRLESLVDVCVAEESLGSRGSDLQLKFQVVRGLVHTGASTCFVTKLSSTCLHEGHPMNLLSESGSLPCMWLSVCEHTPRRVPRVAALRKDASFDVLGLCFWLKAS